MAVAAQLDNGSLVSQEIIIRSMRIVAGRTDPFLDRLMLGFGLLLPPQGIRVAATADLELGTRKQVVLLRGVGRMTLEASPLARQGPVQAIFSEGLIDHIIMAPLAEQVAGPLKLKGIGRPCLPVALVAHPFGHRRVHLVIKQGLLVGSMGVVA